MSVSGVSGVAANSYQPSSAQSQFQQTFGALVSSINSGNLSGAQQAYSSLNQIQSSSQGPSTDPNSPFSQALSQIGQDLQSGNLSSAQQALSSLQQARGGGHHHGHHGGGDNATNSAAAGATTTSTSSTNTVTITA